jgi:hypothetical protein
VPNKRSAEAVRDEVVATLKKMVASHEKPARWIFDGKDGRPSTTTWQNWRDHGQYPGLETLAHVAARLERNLVVGFAPLSDPSATTASTSSEAGMNDEEQWLVERFRQLPREGKVRLTAELLKLEEDQSPQEPDAAAPGRVRQG